jgi:hypothetical protein
VEIELIFPSEIKIFILGFFYGKLKLGKTVWGREASMVSPFWRCKIL